MTEPQKEALQVLYARAGGRIDKVVDARDIDTWTLVVLDRDDYIVCNTDGGARVTRVGVAKVIALRLMQEGKA
jgi:hypothetical protein